MDWISDLIPWLLIVVSLLLLISMIRSQDKLISDLFGRVRALEEVLDDLPCKREDGEDDCGSCLDRLA